jgi:hypothetical protein
MSDFLTHFAPALPEIFVLAMVSLILVIDAALDDSKRYIAYVLSLATVVGAPSSPRAISRPCRCWRWAASSSTTRWRMC